MLLKDSTKGIIKMHGLRIDRAFHNYLYFVFYDIYVRFFLWLGNTLQILLGKTKIAKYIFRAVINRYHAKVITMKEAGKILSLQEDVVLGPDSSSMIIPFPYARSIILKEPGFIAVMDCPCRLARPDPCLPVNVCIAVGRTTAQFWLEHGQKYHARRVSQEEAIRILSEGRKRGNVLTAWFKVATGGRTGVICSCCSCCCGGIEGMRIISKLKGTEGISNIAASGYSVKIHEEKCLSCGKCVEICAFDASGLSPDGQPTIDGLRCLGCGVCVDLCPASAREIFLDPKKGYPLDIDLARRIIKGAG